MLSFHFIEHMIEKRYIPLYEIIEIVIFQQKVSESEKKEGFLFAQKEQNQLLNQNQLLRN
jgi:hypothetical protein